MRVNYTLENTVLTVSINEPSQLEHGGKVSVVPYYGNEAGRKCKKIVHSDFEGNPYIWWNAQKIFLEEYDVPSAEEIVRRYKEKRLDIDDFMAAIRRNKNLAVVCVYPYNCYPVDLQQIAESYSLYNEVRSDKAPISTLYTKKACGFGIIPLQVSTTTQEFEEIFWIKRHMVSGHAYPVILDRPLKEYKQYRFIFADNDYYLHGLNEISYKHLFFRHPRGWRDGGIIKR